MTAKKSSMAGLLAPKGGAAPAETVEESPRVAVKPHAKRAEPVVLASGIQKNLSVKLDPERYRDLRLMAVDTELSHQDLMVRAFDELNAKFKKGDMAW